MENKVKTCLVFYRGYNNKGYVKSVPVAEKLEGNMLGNRIGTSGSFKFIGGQGPGNI